MTQVIDPHNQVFTQSKAYTYTGLYIDPLNIKPEDIDPRDVAHHLAANCRYAGAPDPFYTVAEHCVLLHDYGVEIGLDEQMCKDLLLHDTDEFIFPDLIAPVKHSKSGFGKGFIEAAKKIKEAAVIRFDLSDPEPKIVKELDIRIRADEIAELFPNSPPETRERYDWGDRLDVTIRGWSPKQAEISFLLRLMKYDFVYRDSDGEWRST